VAMVRLKAVVTTTITVVWAFASAAAAFYDLAPQFRSWNTLRIGIWVIQFLLVVAAICFWVFEPPRQMKVDGLQEPPVIHNS
jgi:hypothetical protein